MLGHEPQKWNVPDDVTPRGARFLRSVDVLEFGSPTTPTVLVDEFELPSRDAGERAGSPAHLPASETMMTTSFSR